MARRPLEREEVCLDGGRRTTQLMRDSLDGAIDVKPLLRWSSRVFVLAAGSLLVWTRTEASKVDAPPTYVWLLFLVTVVTLPAAAVQVYKDNDAKSRRNWLLLLAILGLLLVGAILMKPVR